ncbi:tetratricopeptide repeat-containing sensor histidine kinase [Tamlana crocina]|uniref:histidine kinase n=1 Tax=Tamlana crocina TaxID=393006 RepID=A0ABX1D8B7_9FLAO|nr:tetratricopeptide repeat protein [Tamlana crocina]NJX14576.1 tetratricopeptide repeat protein [Tamlana crocina]
MKSILSIVGLWFVLTSAFAQNESPIDSLKFELTKPQPDSVQVKILNELAYYYSYKNIDTSFVYARDALKRAERLGFHAGRAKANLYIGNAFMFTNQYDSARYYFNAASKICDQYNVKKSAVYSSLGILYKAEGNYEKAIDTYFEGIAYDESTNNDYGKFIKLINIGNVYSKMGNLTKSTEYELQALKLAKISKNENMQFALGTLLNNIGGGYAQLKDYDKALQYFNESLAVNTENQNTKEIARNYNNLGVVYHEKGDFEQALHVLKKALKIREDLKDEDEQIETQMVLGTVYGKMKNETLSELHFSKALQIAKKINDKSLISEVYLAMSDSYVLQNNHSRALQNFKNHAQFKDSVLLDNNLKNISEIEIKYQTEKKDKAIVEQQLKLQKQEAQNSFMFGTLIFLVLMSILLFFLFKQRQKRKNQEILTLKREFQIKTLESLIEGEEKERLRIAKELHDGVNGDLSAIKYKLSSLMEMNNAVIKEAIAMIDDSCKQVRAISHNLVPPSLESFNLVEATQVYCDNLNELHSGLNIVFQHLGDAVNMRKKAEINAYRIIQELVANSIKHAEATTINVQISSHGDNVQITVEDEGKGFDKNEVDASGIGLSNVQSRVDYLKAEIDFISNDKGTSYTIDIDKNLINEN